MKDFVLTWYREIIYLILFIIELIISIIVGVKKSKKESPVLMDLLVEVPKYILAAEKILGAGNGQKKRDFVLEEISKLFYEKTGQEIDMKTFRIISESIENILYAPQKKGVK